jgi:TatD DNase family protein
VTDSHAHLDACEAPAALVERALGAGVTRIVTVGTGIDSCRAALVLAEEHPGVHAALGIDPHRAGTAEAHRLDELRELLSHPKAVAVGETGLEGARPRATPEEQRLLFDDQLALADALAAFTGTVVLHCFSSPELLPVALERGYFVSFAGNVTYPSAGDLREAAAVVPSDRLLAETDSPYLAPQPVRGRRNEPAHVLHTVAVLADTRRDDPDELAARLHANAAAAFGLT